MPTRSLPTPSCPPLPCLPPHAHPFPATSLFPFRGRHLWRHGLPSLKSAPIPPLASLPCASPPCPVRPLPAPCVPSLPHASPPCPMRPLPAPCVPSLPHASPPCPMRPLPAPCVSSLPHASPPCPMRSLPAPCVPSLPHASPPCPMRPLPAPCVPSLPHASPPCPMRPLPAPCIPSLPHASPPCPMRPLPAPCVPSLPHASPPCPMRPLPAPCVPSLPHASPPCPMRPLPAPCVPSLPHASPPCPVRPLPVGSAIVAGDDIYGGTDRLLSRVVPRAGVAVRRVDTTDLQAVRVAVGEDTKLVVMESPTNPRMMISDIRVNMIRDIRVNMISDIRAIAEIAYSVGALLLVDNSIMSPMLSQPLQLGADIVMHSGTKFISGHSDVMAGISAVNDPDLAKQVYFVQNAEGSGLSPFDCWVCLRGIKTLPLRLECQQRIAEFLDSHPRVERVFYAGLPSHTNRDLHFSQAKGAGSVLSFTTGNINASKHIVETMKLANIAVSFVWRRPSACRAACRIPAHVRKERGLVEDLIHVSVRIEDVDDLIADLGMP
ncbi:unnamed protein product [Closterium sp. Yama58-4]|nr:unnamed protein product [Closterium sp. Yama58-4]